MRSLSILLTALLSCGLAAAQAGFKHERTEHSGGDRTTVTNSYTKEIGNSGVRVGPSATTTYTKPGKGADGPVPGSQAGSRTDTAYGAAVTIPLPEKRK